MISEMQFMVLKYGLTNDQPQKRRMGTLGLGILRRSTDYIHVVVRFAHPTILLFFVCKKNITFGL